ncbi:MAG: amidotransferase [Acidobacteriota bacterium]|nr:MAG: amidotransferase [Acidobacteriota bacterium]
MKIGLLLCDHVAERFERIEGDYPAMFNRLFARQAADFELIAYDACRDLWPASIDECDAYLTTGSRLSVYDDVPWLRTFSEFLREARRIEKPFVGICFGHQMMAEALGGRVLKSDDGWGAGVHPIRILQRETWMEPFQPVISLQHMHQDQVVELPDEAVLLGSSDHCPVAIFRLGRSMLGIQAHPEFGKEYVGALIEDRLERIGRERADEALESLNRPTDSDLIADWISGFLFPRI